MSRILALDPGTKRIGVAISDETRTLARPLPFLPAQSFNAFCQALKDLIRNQEVDLILVGLPRNMDGSYGTAAEKAREFATRLKERVLVPVQMVDERLTTIMASRQLHEAGLDSRKQKSKIDSTAAQVLLQSYLDGLMSKP
ncbi:MAG: Holliday junction resolvase RuvX [Candidatus Methylacidiphilales bacterium]